MVSKKSVKEEKKVEDEENETEEEENALDQKKENEDQEKFIKEKSEKTEKNEEDKKDYYEYKKTKQKKATEEREGENEEEEGEEEIEYEDEENDENELEMELKKEKQEKEMKKMTQENITTIKFDTVKINLKDEVVSYKQNEFQNTISKIVFKEDPEELTKVSKTELTENNSKANVYFSEFLGEEESFDQVIGEDVFDENPQPSLFEVFSKPRKVFKKKKGTFDHLVLEESKRFSDGSDSSISEDGNEGEDSSELSETMSMKDLISPQPPLGQIDQQDESFKNVFVCESKSRFPPIDKPATPVTSVSKHQTKPSSKLELPSISSPTESEEFDKPHLDFDTTANLSHKSCDDLLSMEGIPIKILERPCSEGIIATGSLFPDLFRPPQPALLSDTFAYLMEYPETNIQLAFRKMEFNRNKTLFNFKDRISFIYNKHVQLIELTHNGLRVEDSMPLICLLEKNMALQDKNQQDIVLVRLREHIYSELKEDKLINVSFRFMPTQITTTKGDVDVIKTVDLKPYLGGYVDNVNCKIYYNATSQTFDKQVLCNTFFNRKSRQDKAVQTVVTRNLCMQTPRDTSTQMTDVGVWRSTKHDKHMGPSGIEIDFDQVIKHSIITVQSYVRRWVSRRVVESRLGLNLKIQYTRAEQMKEMEIEAKRHSLIFNRRLRPQTKDDFDLLFLDLEIWRLKELEKLSTRLSPAKRKAVLATLLDEETKLIRCIGKMQQSLKDDSLVRQFKDFINKVSKPSLIRMDRDKSVTIDTWYKLHSRNLFNHYKTLENTTTFLKADDERFAALTVLKEYLNTICHKALEENKVELIDLIDREVILTLKKVSKPCLMALRKRINQEFKILIKKPQFNEAVERHQNSTLRSKHVSTILFCYRCLTNQPVERFQMSTNSSNLFSGKLCENCQRINNRACKRADNSLFHTMLLRLRVSEREFNDDAEIAFLTQEKDLEYLVNSVWQMRSAISKNPNLRDLVFVRWDLKKHWSPWNCFLVTNFEAYVHQRDGVTYEEIYSEALIKNVKLKHIRARSDFKKLWGYASKFSINPKTASKVAAI